MNKNGKRKGTNKSDSPHVQVLPTIAVMIMVSTVRLTMKQPPLLRYWTKTVDPSIHIKELQVVALSGFPCISK
jgi:hypothetical protein